MLSCWSQEENHQPRGQGVILRLLKRSSPETPTQRHEAALPCSEQPKCMGEPKIRTANRQSQFGFKPVCVSLQVI